MKDNPEAGGRKTNACQANGREVPDLHRGRARRAPLPPWHLLLLLALPEVRLRAQQPARPAGVPEVPRALPPGEGDEARGSHRVLQQPGVLLSLAGRSRSERRRRLILPTYLRATV